MIEEQTKWKADPRRGAEFVEPRRAEVVALMQQAADIAFYAIEDELKREIEAANRKAGEKRANIMKEIQKAETAPAMEIVRKHWSSDRDSMLGFFGYQMTGSGKV